MGTLMGFFLAATSTVTSVTVLLLGIGTLIAKADKPDPHKPVHAIDIILVPKITLQVGQTRCQQGTEERSEPQRGFSESRATAPRTLLPSVSPIIHGS